jgi:ABC-type phosphate transport system substrate-binding protein
MPNVWVVPTLAQGVAIVFNLPDENSLELNITREDLADIFLGRIRRWDELAKTNPGLASVRENITLIVRADESTDSKLLTSALSSFSREWKAKVGASAKPRWPRADGLRFGSVGVAVHILMTPYSLGYVSLSGIASTGARVARISNKAGRFVLPTESSVVAAMDAFAPELDEMGKQGATVLSYDIVDPSQDMPDAYPIVGYTYLAFNAARLDCTSLLAMVFLIHWTWTNPRAAEVARLQTASPLPAFTAVSASVSKVLLPVLDTLRCDQNVSGAGPPSEQGGFTELEKVIFMVNRRIVGSGQSIP